MSEIEKATPLGFVRVSELRTGEIQYQQDFINRESKVYTLRKNYSNVEMTSEQMQEHFKTLYPWFTDIAIIEQEEKDLPEDEKYIRKLLRRCTTKDIFDRLSSFKPLRELSIQERRVSLSNILRILRPLEEEITIRCLKVGTEVQTSVSKFRWSNNDDLAAQEARTLAVIALHIKALVTPKMNKDTIWNIFT